MGQNGQFHYPIISAALLISILTASSSSSPIGTGAAADGCGIAVYWGLNGTEGTLKEACDSGYYKYINIGFLRVLGGTPDATSLYLADHCDPDSGGCVWMSADIRHCQNRGIKVLLSVAGGVFDTETNPASVLADYIWTTYLAGSGSSSRPLGDAPLDGVDLAVTMGPQEYFRDLVKALKYEHPERNVTVSASPHNCIYPHKFLGLAMKETPFDYVWVNFFNRPECDYTTGADGVVSVWNTWAENTPAASKLLLGVPASPEATKSGYIPPDVLENEILPEIGRSKAYGGVMVFHRYYDANYSASVGDAVCPSASAAAGNEYEISSGLNSYFPAW